MLVESLIKETVELQDFVWQQCSKQGNGWKRN